MKLAVAAAVIACCAIPVAARDEPPSPGKPPAAPPAAEDRPPASDETRPPPTLDELLGIDGEGETAPEDVAEREAAEELDRQLREDARQQEICGALSEAIDKMGLAAEQLDERFDPGLGTQRVQEEILAKLEYLINESKKQKQSGGASSSSSSSPAPASSPPEPGKQGSQNSPQEQRNNNPSDSQEGESPPPQPLSPNAVFDESRTEWGNLPQRVREMLLQGRKEKFSSLYDQLTREYYRRLAEDGSP